MTQTQSEGTPFNSKARAVFKQTGATLLCVVKCRAKEKYILFTIEHLKYNNTLRTNKEGGVCPVWIRIRGWLHLHQPLAILNLGPDTRRTCGRQSQRTCVPGLWGDDGASEVAPGNYSRHVILSKSGKCLLTHLRCFLSVMNLLYFLFLFLFSTAVWLFRADVFVQRTKRPLHLVCNILI